MPKGNCVFSALWLEHEDYKGWIAEIRENKFAAFCRLCKKTFEVKATGEAAVKKHAAGKKHQELEKACKPAIPLSSFVVTKTPSTSSSTMSSASASNSKTQSLFVCFQ